MCGEHPNKSKAKQGIVFLFFRRNFNLRTMKYKFELKLDTVTVKFAPNLFQAQLFVN